MGKREWSPCQEIKPSFYFFWEMRMRDQLSGDYGEAQ